MAEQESDSDDLTILRALASPFTYYWSIRIAARELLFRLLRRSHGREREIHLRPRGSYQTASRDGAVWNVTLPDCCAVCGGLPNLPPERQTRQAPDLLWPVAAPLVGAALGGVMGLLLGSFWWLPVVLSLSFLVGFLLRKNATVHVQLRRCREHKAVEPIPKLFAFAGSVWIRTWHVKVGQKFDVANGLPPRESVAATPERVAAKPQRAAAAPAVERTARAPPSSEDAERAAHEAALREPPRGRLRQAGDVVVLVVAVVAILIATPLAFKHAEAQVGPLLGLAMSASMLYLILGAMVLQLCCRLFAGGTPDYPTALMAVFLAVVVWNGMIVFLHRMPPPMIDFDTMTWPVALHAAGYIGGVLIYLFVVPAVVYVWLLEMTLPLATLVFFTQHLLTSLAAIGLALAAIKLLPAWL